MTPLAATLRLAVLTVLTSGALALQASAAQPEAEPAGSDQNQEQSPVHVAMNTTKGTIYLALNKAKAPVTVENFLAYAADGFYDGTIFHRVIEDFMIQGGGFTKDLDKKPTKDPIKNEWENGLSNTRGTIAMARLGGNADSATSQFFINLSNNDFLDRPRDGAGYAVFGRVVKGLDVLDEIGGVRVHAEGVHQHVPDEPVVIESVEVLSAERVEELGLPAPETDTPDGDG